MLGELLKSEQYKYVFSLLLGISLVIVVFRPYCKGDECSIWKAPPTAELNDAVFKIGQKCYTYKERDVECGKGNNIIEAFRGEFVCRPKTLTSGMTIGGA